MSEWASLWFADKLISRFPRADKRQTYKIISHQKLSFVIFSCDVVFLHQGFYIFVHVHPLDCLLYLSLALEAAKVYSYNIHQSI